MCNFVNDVNGDVNGENRVSDDTLKIENHNIIYIVNDVNGKKYNINI